MLKRYLAGILGLTILACTPPAPTPYPTPSGQPEVTIAAPKPEVREHLAAFLIGQRFTIVRADEYGLVASTHVNENPLPIITLWYSLVEVPAGTRITARATVLHQYGERDETYELPGQIAQTVLNNVAHEFVR